MRQMSANSLMAYQGLKDKLTERERWVLEGLTNIYPASAEEVAQYLNVYPNIISGRFTGLKKKGYIVPAYRVDNERGQKVTKWKPFIEHEQLSLDCA